MARNLSDEDLVAKITKAVSDSESYTESKLANERQQVQKYYRGELPAPMHKGDSKYVSRDVFDAVDSMRSTVLEAFSASTRIVFFRPERGDSVDDAKQATEFCRQVFYRDNPGEDILYNVVTDGLTNRMAVVKVYYDEDEDYEEYDFKALTPQELTKEVSRHEDYEFVETNLSKNGLYSGTYRVSKTTKRIVVEDIQPEDFLIASGSRSVQDARFCCHRTNRRKDWFVRKYGDKVAEEIKYGSSGVHIFDFEKQIRFDSIGQIQGSHDESVEEATLYECYVRLDMDGSGRARLWKVDFAGGKVLAKERVSMAPFSCYVPIPTPHTFIGENFAQSVIPVQNARTILIRQIINHSLITNNPRQQVLNGVLANPAELLDNRLGGIVNVRRLDGIAPIPQAPLNPFIFNLIQMIDEDKEEVTGISKLSQGMNKDAISTQNAQGMVEQLISASQQRTKLIARRFGQFLKDTFFLIYNTAVDHMDQKIIVDVSGVSAEVDPSLWKNRSAASIELTLGYGEQEAEAAKWQEIDMVFSQDPQLQPLYDLPRRYEVIRRTLEKRGVEDIESILTPPDQAPPPQPDPMAELQMQQMQSQVEYQKAQAQAMLMKAETDKINAETERMRVMNDMQIKQGTAALNEQKFQHDQMVDVEELRLAEKASEQKAVYNPS